MPYMQNGTGNRTRAPCAQNGALISSFPLFFLWFWTIMNDSDYVDASLDLLMRSHDEIQNFFSRSVAGCR